MSIYGPDSDNDTTPRDTNDIDLSRYATLQHIRTLLSKSGDTMYGQLNMRGHLIRGLPTTYPPRYTGDEATSWTQSNNLVRQSLETCVKLDGTSVMNGSLSMGEYKISDVGIPMSEQDAATKGYVDRRIRKPILTIWAECNGGLTSGAFSFSFGSGASGSGHGKAGYTMIFASRITHMGISQVNKDGEAIGGCTISLVVDGITLNRGIRKPDDVITYTNAFYPPVLVNAGSVINFVSKFNRQTASTTVVSLIIELNI